jgi:plastocyanin
MKNSRSIMTASALAVALILPSAAWAQTETELAREDVCLNPELVPDDQVVIFGALNSNNQNRLLVPEEATINKGGTVTFQVLGGGHRIAIYPVSKNTFRGNIVADCTSGSCTIIDGDGNVVIEFLPTAGVIDYAPGRLLFLTGSPTNGALATGTTVQYRFPEDGLYLVICANRGHFVNDAMFGFVNVVNCFSKGRATSP